MGINTEKGFIEYRHVRVIDPPIAVTIRFDVNQDNTEITSSWATLSHKDNFCRSLGRDTADKAMNEGRSIVYKYDRECSLTDNFGASAAGIISELADQYEDMIEYKKAVDKQEFRKIFELQRALETIDYIDEVNQLYTAMHQIEDAANAVNDNDSDVTESLS